MELSFLKDVELTGEDIERISGHMGNWMKLYPYLYSPETTEEEINKLFKYEIENNCRMHILLRIKRRLNRFRNEREAEEITICASQRLNEKSADA